MPAFPLPENNIWQIATFLRSLSTPAFLVPVSGDVRAGADIYQKQNCSSCHMIYGHGGFLGPDLTDIAASRTVKQLRQSILKPADRPIQGFAGVTVTTKDGEHITGIAKNYSDYSIDILDANGHLHLLDTADLLSLDFSSQSLMPSYSHLSTQVIQDLLAFISRQTVRPDARPDQRMSHHEEH
jgi:putative heme-binding domain-containing protein